jgi:hypothetical protein
MADDVHQLAPNYVFYWLSLVHSLLDGCPDISGQLPPTIFFVVVKSSEVR